MSCGLKYEVSIPTLSTAIAQYLSFLALGFVMQKGNKLISCSWHNGKWTDVDLGCRKWPFKDSNLMGGLENQLFQINAHAENS